MSAIRNLGTAQWWLPLLLGLVVPVALSCHARLASPYSPSAVQLFARATPSMQNFAIGVSGHHAAQSRVRAVTRHAIRTCAKYTEAVRENISHSN
ncbi:hypothetical protein GY45DRAFT_1369704 [Cubamyces sp. BRFM 1775]|nr:hypothetical protein GY45DRAFT_1369704 [Cubamyces sp. BRFM 1775]